MTKQTQQKLLISNSTWMTFGLGIRAVFQAGYFIIVARAIGPSEYGIFTSFMALVSVFAPYASWGSGNILVKYTSRDHSLFGKYWGAAIATTLASSFILTILSLILAKAILPDTFNFWLVLSITLAELFIARLIYVAAQAFQAIERLDITATIYILFSGIRLLCAILFFYTPFPLTALTWAFFYLASTIISLIPSMLWVYRTIGWGKINVFPMLSELKEGFYFSLSLSSQGMYNDIDKTLLAKISSTETAGLYATAYRIIDISFVPVTALLNSTYARFFRHGASGISQSKSFALKLLPWSLVYTLLAVIFTALVSPLIPVFLGNNYVQTQTMLWWLLPLLPLKAIHYFAADSLTGAGFQGLRSSIQMSVSIFNIGLNIWLIPRLGWQGAAIASWASDGLLAITLWLVVLYKSSRKVL